MTKKLFGTLSFAALMSAIMVRLFLELAFGGEHPLRITPFEAVHGESPAPHSRVINSNEE